MRWLIRTQIFERHHSQMCTQAVGNFHHIFEPLAASTLGSLHRLGDSDLRLFEGKREIIGYEAEESALGGLRLS